MIVSVKYEELMPIRLSWLSIRPGTVRIGVGDGDGDGDGDGQVRITLYLDTHCSL